MRTGYYFSYDPKWDTSQFYIIYPDRVEYETFGYGVKGGQLYVSFHAYRIMDLTEAKKPNIYVKLNPDDYVGPL